MKIAMREPGTGGTPSVAATRAAQQEQRIPRFVPDDGVAEFWNDEGELGVTVNEATGLRPHFKKTNRAWLRWRI